MEMITTDTCENCRYGTVLEENKALIKVYCSIKDKTYFYGQCIPCENKTEDSNE